jgi:hypothetical protein
MPGNGTSRSEVGCPRVFAQPSGAATMYGLRRGVGGRRATAHCASSVSCRSTSTPEAYDARHSQS